MMYVCLNFSTNFRSVLGAVDPLGDMSQSVTAQCKLAEVKLKIDWNENDNLNEKP